MTPDRRGLQKEDYVHKDHSFSTYAKFSEKLSFLTPRYAHVHVRMRGYEMMVFRKILDTYYMNDPIPVET